jgi:uncharacterized protein with HEPN domain
MPLEVRQAALLHDMLESARRAVSYTVNRTRADLDKDPMLADAVERRLEIIGEAARGLSDEFKTAHPDIPWRSIMATRHILAHDYDEVNHDIVWRIVQDHLPPLINKLAVILAQSPP